MKGVLMKKRKGILLVLTALSLGMFATVPAVASVAGEQTWVWSGTGGSAIFDMDYLNTDADDSFNLVVGSQSFTAISQGYLFAQFDQPTLSLSFGFVMNAPPPASTPLEYSFSFTDGANTYFTYSVEQLSNTAYVLRNSDTGMKISYQGADIHVSGSPVNPVPIPGAALLLGSALMGLLGIGSRTKQA